MHIQVKYVGEIINIKLNDKTLTFLMFLIAAAISITSQSVITTGLKYLMMDFNIPSSTAQLSYSVFLITMGVMIPPTAYIVNKFNLKTIITSSLSLFIWGSFISSISPNLFILLIGRVLQAAGTGIIMPVTQIVIFKIIPEEKWSLGMGIYGVLVGILPVFGPTLGGYITEMSSWRTIFIIFTVLGLVALLLSLVFVKINIEQKPHTLDLYSLILSIVFCIGIMIGFSNISEYGLDISYVLLPIILGFISVMLFVRRQKMLEFPLVNLRVLKSRYFVFGTTFISLLYFTIIAINVIIPLFVQNIANYSATTSGLILLPASLSMFIFNFFGPLLADKIGIKKVLTLSCIFSIVGFLFMMTYTQSTSIEYMILTQIIRGIGAGLGLTPATTWTMSVVSYAVDDATAINNTLRQISGAIGSALSVVILTIFAGGSIGHNVKSVQSFSITSFVLAIIIMISLFIVIKYIINKDDIKKQGMSCNE